MSDDRDYTEKYAELRTDEDLYMNRNVDWINYKGTKLGYLFIIAVVLSFLSATQLFKVHETWTVTNLAHMIVRAILYIVPVITFLEFTNYFSCSSLNS